MTSQSDEQQFKAFTIRFTDRDYQRMENLIKRGIFATKNELVRQAVKQLLDYYEEED